MATATSETSFIRQRLKDEQTCLLEMTDAN